jgi:asparagine N-glycosylation enzyme membrane subunit Stt3
MEMVAAVLVLLGYGVALPVIFRMRRVFDERRGGWFAVFMAAMAIIVTGHSLAGRPLAAALNGAGALIMAGAWWEMGRRRRAPGTDA